MNLYEHLSAIKEELLTQSKEHYSPFIKFIPLCSFIEMMGACYDKHPLLIPDKTELPHDKSVSIYRDRFYKGLKSMGTKYTPFAKKDSQFDLWRDLRCPLLHVASLNENIGVLSEVNNTNNAHLKNLDGKLLISYHELLKDAVKAFEKITPATVDSRKLDSNSLEIENLIFEGKGYDVTGGTSEITFEFGRGYEKISAEEHQKDQEIRGSNKTPAKKKRKSKSKKIQRK